MGYAPARPAWVPDSAYPRLKEKWVRQLERQQRPLITLKPEHERPQPVACLICGEYAASLVLTDVRRRFATCSKCKWVAHGSRYRFRDLSDERRRPFDWPDEVHFEAAAVMIAIAHLEATP